MQKDASTGPSHSGLWTSLGYPALEIRNVEPNETHRLDYLVILTEQVTCPRFTCVLPYDSWLQSPQNTKALVTQAYRLVCTTVNL